MMYETCVKSNVSHTRISHRHNANTGNEITHNYGELRVKPLIVHVIQGKF